MIVGEDRDLLRIRNVRLRIYLIRLFIKPKTKLSVYPQNIKK